MIGQTLGHYRIESKLGEGGMGVVYKARDTHLDRLVAIKVLPADKVADAGRKQRFVQEAKAASALNHPNIVTIHDIRSDEGMDFIVMEYIEGQTLDELIAPKGVRPAQVLKYAVQIADALAKAHGAGIVHRDLKPSNIMVADEGRVKVLDFGLAKLLEPADSSAEDATLTARPLTEEGSVLGTAAYMSPEQAEGRKLDGRSDIFSFGAVLYEMVSGRKPFTGDSRLAMLTKILNEDPTPPAQLATSIPLELEKLILRCLRKDPARRYQTMADLKVALEDMEEESASGPQAQPSAAQAPSRWRWAWAVLLPVLLIVAGGAVWWQTRLVRPGPGQIRSIAVLPLQNLSGDPRQEFFSDGVTEQLISTLGQVHAFQKVISRASVMRYKETTKLLPEIGRELGVDAIVEGSVQRDRGRIRVRVQLMQASTDTQLWAREFDRDLADLLNLESEVAGAIAGEIKLQLTAQERAELGRPRAVNPKAYDAYLRGRQSWNKQTGPNVQKAIEEFKKAIDEDPNYAPAYAGLADGYSLLGFFAAPPRDVWSSAKAAAEKAQQIAPTLAEGHVSLGVVRGFYDWAWPDAEGELKKAIALNPSLADAHHWLSHVMEATGQFDEGFSEMKRAVELDPLSPVFREDLAMVHYFRRDYDQTLSEMRKLLELEPNFWRTHQVLGVVYRKKGMFREAIAEFEKARGLGMFDSMLIAELAHTYASSARSSEARRLLQELEDLSKRSYVDPVEIALIYAGLGENDRLLEWVQKAFANRSPRFALWARLHPDFDSVRSDPRFANVLRQMRLLP